MLLVATAPFHVPNLDYHALAPEIVVTATLVVVLVADLFLSLDRKWLLSSVSGSGLLLALVFVVELGARGHHASMVGGAYVVDDFALVFKGLFVVVGYIVLLMSTNSVTCRDEACHVPTQWSVLPPRSTSQSAPYSQPSDSHTAASMRGAASARVADSPRARAISRTMGGSAISRLRSRPT